LLHSIVISLVSECHHHPLMMHLSTHQDISHGLIIVHVHHLEKHLMGQVVYTSLGMFILFWVVYTFLGKYKHMAVCGRTKTG